MNRRMTVENPRRISERVNRKYGSMDNCSVKSPQHSTAMWGSLEQTRSDVHEVLRSTGIPLDSGTLAFMEPCFNFDFSRVRVHADSNAAEAAHSLNARAYTIGQDVVFARGKYAPDTGSGRQLLAHELTHVVQQQHSAYGTGSRASFSAGEGLEREAARTADRVTGGQHIGEISGRTAPRLQRDVDPQYRRMLAEVSVARLYQERRSIEDRLAVLQVGSIEWIDTVQQEQMILEELEMRGFPLEPVTPSELSPERTAPESTTIPRQIGASVPPRGRIGPSAPAVREPNVTPPSQTPTATQGIGPSPHRTDIPGTVVVLGRYERPVAAAGGRSLPVMELLMNDAQRATGLRPQMLGGLPGFRETFPQLAPSALASAATVQEGLEGGGPRNIRAIYLDTTDVDFYRGGDLSRASAAGHQRGAGAQTSAEYRNLIAAIGARTHRVDIYIRHEEGLSIIRAGRQDVEGASLPEFLSRHLAPSFFRQAGPAAPGRITSPEEPAQSARSQGVSPVANDSSATAVAPGRIPASVRNVAAPVGITALGIGLNLFAAYLRNRYQQRQIEASVRSMEPEIRSCLLQLDPEITRLCTERQPNDIVYANLTIILHYETGLLGMDIEAGPVRDYLGADLSSVAVSLRNLQSERMEYVSSGFGYSRFDTYVTYSIPLQQ